MRDMRDFAGQELRKMLCFSKVSWLRGLARAGQVRKAEVAKDRLPGSTKFASRLRVKSISTTLHVRNTFGSGGAQIRTTPARESYCIGKSKSLKTGGSGALLEVEFGKIGTMPARKSDLEAKIAKKNWQARSTFGS